MFVASTAYMVDYRLLPANGLLRPSPQMTARLKPPYNLKQQAHDSRDMFVFHHAALLDREMVFSVVVVPPANTTMQPV